MKKIRTGETKDLFKLLCLKQDSLKNGATKVAERFSQHISECFNAYEKSKSDKIPIFVLNLDLGSLNMCFTSQARLPDVDSVKA